MEGPPTGRVPRSSASFSRTWRAFARDAVRLGETAGNGRAAPETDHAVTSESSVVALASEHGQWLASRIRQLAARFPTHARLLEFYAEYVLRRYVDRVTIRVPRRLAPHDELTPLAQYALLEELARVACEAGDFSKFIYYYGDGAATRDLEAVASSVSAFETRFFSTPVARQGLPTPKGAWTEDSWIRRRRPDYAARFPIKPLGGRT